MNYDLVISKGSTGRIVERMQLELNRRGESLLVDGECGAKTLLGAARALTMPAPPKTLGRRELLRLGIDVRLGIDLSGHNEGGPKGLVDFKQLEAEGVDFCWLKLTEGSRYENREALRHAAECHQHGIAFDGYHFGDPSAKRPLDLADLAADAVAEAEHFLSVRRAYFGDTATLRPVLDLERMYQAKLTAAAWAAIGGTPAKRAELCALWCLVWLEHVARAAGRGPMIYTGRWAWNAFVLMAPEVCKTQLRQYPLWLASYNSGAAPKRTIERWPWTVWQFSGSGQIPGVDGKVDLNWALAEDIGL